MGKPWTCFLPTKPEWLLLRWNAQYTHCSTKTPTILLHIVVENCIRYRKNLNCNSLNFNKANFDIVTELLLQVDWSRITSCSSLDDAVTFYESTVCQILQRVVPKGTPKNSPPWSSPHLKSLRRRMNRSSRAYRVVKNGINRHKFFADSNAYRRENERLYKNYIARTEAALKSNPKSFWRFVNSKRKDDGLPPSMFLGDSVADTTPKVCNLFAERFASVFTDEALSNDDIQSATVDVPLNFTCSYGFAVCDNDIIRACKKLKCSRSPGPDGIPTCVLIKCIPSLLVPLRHIFNMSLSMGSFPSRWKNSYMFPVFKKGDRRDISNYRGITSLCSSSKLLELLVSEHLMFKLKTYISPDQHGFFPGRSVTSNLLDFTSFVTRSMEQRHQVDAVYTDLKAAFDCLNHAIIIAKLEKLGVQGHLLNWIRSYLTDRSLRVKLGSSISNPLAITSGVPQGSNLGPLLFIIFFNDVSRSLTPHGGLFYADDLKIYSVVRNTDDTTQLQHTLDSFLCWCNRNRMTLSLDKCSVITFTYKKSPIVADYKMGTTSLNRVHQVCDLGVLLDTKLSFNDHMTSVISRANRQLGFILRICRSFTDPYCLRSLYFSLVRSILEFSSIIWSPFYACWSDRIEAVQRRFIRYALARLPWRDPLNLPPYDERCRLLNVEPLSLRRNKSAAMFVAKILLGEIDSPAILGNLDFNVPARQLRSSQFFYLPFRRTNYGQNDPIRRICSVFNNYSYLFDFNVSSQSFKRSLDLTIIRR